MAAISPMRHPRPRPRWLLFAPVVALSLAIAAGGAAAQGDPGVLRWAGDPEGGAPFVQARVDQPDRLEGFDVDLAELLARGLGRTPRFELVAFASIDQSIGRGDADIGLSGIEDTPARRSAMAVTIPYYRFREVIAVRDADATTLRRLSDFRGRRVGTLGGTLAYEILLRAEADHALTAVSYDDDVHPFDDLLMGRLDGVLLDNVLALRRAKSMRGFTIQPESVAVGHYVGVLGRSNTALRDACDDLIRRAMRDGSLERIFRRWEVWNEDQPALHAQVLAGIPTAPLEEIEAGDLLAPVSPWRGALRYMPALLRASGVTLVLSCSAMLLAVALGILVASGRVYGPPVLRGALVAYVEVVRGTPILLQLFVLYYGLAAAVRLPAFVAAFLGLALNYGAYESEIYRGALEAVGRGQLEAARVLGFTERQIFLLIRGPQAFRLALAPMTNDFVALLKDSSLVSVLTVVELTKQTQIFATNVGSWVVPGALCAVLYLAMSLPLSALARRLEARWKVGGA